MVKSQRLKRKKNNKHKKVEAQVAQILPTENNEMDLLVVKAKDATDRKIEQNLI